MPHSTSIPLEVGGRLSGLLSTVGVWSFTMEQFYFYKGEALPFKILIVMDFNFSY